MSSHYERSTALRGGQRPLDKKRNRGAQNGHGEWRAVQGESNLFRDSQGQRPGKKCPTGRF